MRVTSLDTLISLYLCDKPLQDKSPQSINTFQVVFFIVTIIFNTYGLTVCNIIIAYFNFCFYSNSFNQLLKLFIQHHMAPAEIEKCPNSSGNQSLIP